MDTKELRLGNYILHDKEIQKVHHIGYLHVYLDKSGVVHKERFIEPAPLNIEILNRIAGIESCKYYTEHTLRFNATFKNSQIIITINDHELQIATAPTPENCLYIYLVRPNYLHEFQNIVYAITKNEIELI